MLGKLMKYEFKSTGRTLLPIYGALLVSALLMRLLAIDGSAGVMGSTEFGQGLVAMITGFLFIALLVASAVLTLVITLQRFSKNLLGEEGYLSMTLPVKPWQHIVSKLTVSVCWYITSCLVAIGSFMILIFEAQAMRYFFQEFGMLMRMLFWNWNWTYIVEFTLFALLSTVTGVLLLYASMALGQISNRNRKLTSFGFFLLLCFGLQIITSIISRIVGNSLDFNYYYMGVNNQIHIALWLNIALYAAYSAGFFALTNYMLTKRLNLE